MPKSDRPIDLLLQEFEELYELSDFQKRGFMLQDLLKKTFDFFEIPLTKSFTRNEGAEQIDGAFEFDGWHYIVECRWRGKLANGRETDGLLGPIGRSGSQTMGLFLSINGWSDNVITVLKQNPNKCIILMNGDDLRKILSKKVDLGILLKAKLKKLNNEAKPFYGAGEFIKDQAASK